MPESKFRELERWARLRIQAMIDLSRVPSGGTTGQVVTKTATGYAWATNTASGNAFGTVAVSGQSNVVADTANDTLTLVAGSGVTLTTNATTDTVTIAAVVSDGDKGDITVSASGATFTIDAATVTLAKMANLAANSIIGNNTGGVAVPLALTATQAKALLAIASGDVSGLGSLATQSGTFSGTSSGTNTGDNATNTQYSGLVSNATHTGDATGATALTIAADAVTYAKLQNAVNGNVVLVRANPVSGDYGEMQLAVSQLLGRGSVNDIAAIILGTNLSMSGTTLNAAGYSSYTPGAFTVATGRFQIFAEEIELTGVQELTLEGTSTLVIL